MQRKLDTAGLQCPEKEASQLLHHNSEHVAASGVFFFSVALHLLLCSIRHPFAFQERPLHEAGWQAGGGSGSCNMRFKSTSKILAKRMQVLQNPMVTCCVSCSQCGLPQGLLRQGRTVVAIKVVCNATRFWRSGNQESAYPSVNHPTLPKEAHKPSRPLIVSWQGVDQFGKVLLPLPSARCRFKF